MKIRKYKKTDSLQIVKILKLNNQYDFPKIEGPTAMNHVSKCPAAISFVAESNKKVVGYIKGIYDGSRALIHLLSIHPSYQNQGIGKLLLNKIENEFFKRGATGASVTVTDNSMKYWKKNGYIKLPVYLMLKTNIKNGPR